MFELVSPEKRWDGAREVACVAGLIPAETFFSSKARHKGTFLPASLFSNSPALPRLWTGSNHSKTNTALIPR